MSIARAFTTRRARQPFELKDAAPYENALTRSKTAKVSLNGGSIRNKISAPVRLTHTTNMLSYNAPEIFPQPVSTTAAATPSSSTKSDDDSDSGSTAASTPPTSPDTVFSDNKAPMSPELNHLSCYFTPPKQATDQLASNNTIAVAATRTAAATGSPASDARQLPVAAPAAWEAPAIPQRSPSHTKKASYEGLTRHRSASRLSEQSSGSLSSKASFSFSRSSSSSTSTSMTSLSHSSSVSHAAKPSVYSPPARTLSTSASVPSLNASRPPLSHRKEYSESHPFGHELAKVSELVEEFGKDKIVEEVDTAPIVDEEERELLRRGLKKFSADDYIREIQDLVANFLAESRPLAPMWI